MHSSATAVYKVKKLVVTLGYFLYLVKSVSFYKPELFSLIKTKTEIQTETVKNSLQTDFCKLLNPRSRRVITCLSPDPDLRVSLPEQHEEQTQNNSGNV